MQQPSDYHKKKNYFNSTTIVKNRTIRNNSKSIAERLPLNRYQQSEYNYNVTYIGRNVPRNRRPYNSAGNCENDHRENRQDNYFLDRGGHRVQNTYDSINFENCKEDIKLINISDRILTKEEEVILQRGLKFTPTPFKANLEEMKEDISEFTRKVRLAEFFFDKEDKSDDSLVKTVATLYRLRIETLL